MFLYLLPTCDPYDVFCSTIIVLNHSSENTCYQWEKNVIFRLVLKNILNFVQFKNTFVTWFLQFVDDIVVFRIHYLTNHSMLTINMEHYFPVEFECTKDRVREKTLKTNRHNRRRQRWEHYIVEKANLQKGEREV